MTDFYSQNRCVCSTRSHGPLLCAFCLSFHFNDDIIIRSGHAVPVTSLRGEHSHSFKMALKLLQEKQSFYIFSTCNTFPPST